MGAAKKYLCDYDDYENGMKTEDLVDRILDDPEFQGLNELIIGSWGQSWDDSCQPILDGIVSNADRFSHIEKLFVGDMNYEECEVSWIIQGNYSQLWAAMPQLKELTIKGSSELELGTVCHQGLEALTIICGGLPVSVIQSIQAASLPNLKKLLLYIGSEWYGFDGNADTIKTFLEKADFPKLEYLGIADSEIQDELAEVVLKSKFMGQIRTLDLSCGTLSDKGGALLLETLPSYPNIKKLDIHYHYLSDDTVERLKALPLELDASDPNEADYDDGTIYRNAMLTE